MMGSRTGGRLTGKLSRTRRVHWATLDPAYSTTSCTGKEEAAKESMLLIVIVVGSAGRCVGVGGSRLVRAGW